MQGSPRWFEDRFDINAVIPRSVSSVEGPRLMLQTLLAERFGLRVRWPTQEQPVYALVVARRDKRLGPGLKPSTMDCEASRAKQAETPPLESVLSGRATCDMIFQPFRAHFRRRADDDRSRKLLRAASAGRSSSAGSHGIDRVFRFRACLRSGPARGARGFSCTRQRIPASGHPRGDASTERIGRV